MYANYTEKSESEDEFEQSTQAYLSDEAKHKIQIKMNEVVVPKGISRILSQVGLASNGKLKASEWCFFFTVYIPLVFFELFVAMGMQSDLLLVNTGALIQCTEIVEAKAITEEDSNIFSQAYELYQKTANQLFQNIKITPNHHYSMHMPGQLMNWGPLMGMSEFGGERLIKTLQKIKTNSLNGAMEETIMKKFGQMQRLHKTTELYDQLLIRENRPSPILTKKELDDEMYLKLFNYLKEKVSQLTNYHHLPYPPNRPVLRNYITERQHWKWNFGLLVSKASPNNIIYLKDSLGEFKFGKVCHILDLECEDIHKGPVVLVQWLTNITMRMEGFEHLDSFLSTWKVNHLTLTNNLAFISISDILGLGAYCQLPAWSLGCQELSMLTIPINKLVGLESYFGTI
ncbi:hypothetical protein O181_117767 [Austropuccinia psidii MF-1]|uniref:Uncharacterized protein n=1 Tax=Austropuccinia psidii MF-1 TaxID=1389203 RepID=A0A9Q3KBV7_9BASI|nr:hypothetical protein [Austropuccinia psidii MF-1]